MIGVGHVQTNALTREYVEDVLNSNWYSPGKWCKRFEQEWAKLHDRRWAVFMNSGTSALQVGLHAMKEKYGWQTGYKVIVPALTFVASVNVILSNRLKPVFVDVDRYYGIDLSSPPPADTVAIMAVHLNGQMCDMEKVAEYADFYDLRIIEDSCETVAAPFKGRVAWGDISCYSTYACHHLTTGVGGFACTDDPDLAALIRSLANHGRDGVFFDPKATAGERVSKRFYFERQGYSYRASEFEAAVGCAQLPGLGADLHKRREVAAALTSALAGLPLVLPKQRPGAAWNPMFYPVLSQERDDLCVYLEENGVETRPFLPLTCQPVYRNLVNEEDFPFAERVNREGFYVAAHPGLSEQDIAYIAERFHEFFAR